MSNESSANMYVIRHLNRADIDRVFPLVQIACPEIDLAVWRRFADRIVGSERTVAGLIGAETALGHMAGLFRYKVDEDRPGGRTLVCDCVVTPTLLSYSALISDMKGAASEIGRMYRCETVAFPNSAKFRAHEPAAFAPRSMSAFTLHDDVERRNSMTIKHVLVHVDESQHLDARLEIAIALAGEHEAHLSGLYVIAPPFIPTYMAGHVGAAFYENHEKIAQESAARAESAFVNKADAAGLSYEWLTGKGEPADVLATMGRYADVIVIGQPDPDEVHTSDPAHEMPGDLILGAGRPVLVVPYAGKFKNVGKNVLVMWNASREASRAINDSLPILQRARKVVVTSANSGRGGLDLGDLPGADISHQLARHGVQVESAPTFADDIDIGDLILSRASDMSADLIVMGGYGRSRFREMILGGATHHILNHMTVPVLFSH